MAQTLVVLTSGIDLSVGMVMVLGNCLVTVEATGAVPDDRTIVVDGSEISFAGVRLDGSDRWTGMAKVGDVSVKIITAASIPSLAIGSSRDTGLPESPPP